MTVIEIEEELRDVIQHVADGLGKIITPEKREEIRSKVTKGIAKIINMELMSA